jgi:hypothetical protein
LNANAGATLKALDGSSLSSGNLSATNDTTGANSDNDATITVSNDISIQERNDADVDNDIDFDINTGNNTANNNTGDGESQSGDASFKIQVKNILN